MVLLGISVTILCTIKHIKCVSVYDIIPSSASAFNITLSLY